MLKEVDLREGLHADCDSDMPELYPSKLGLNAGFVLSDPEDSRYQSLQKHRERFGNVIHQAASVLGDNVGGEDHIDAVILVLRVSNYARPHIDVD